MAASEAGSGPARAGGARRLMLLGPPNSGKGTQAAILGSRLGVPIIATGDMLRETVAAGTSLGRRVDGILTSGRLVDDETMTELVRERLSRPDVERGFILDGYPRTTAQAETLDEILERRGERLDAVVLIRVGEEELVRRALGRGRVDDRREVVRERIRVYREKTEPLIGYYRSLGLLHEVDGDQTVEEVTESTAAVLAETGSRGPSATEGKVSS